MTKQTQTTLLIPCTDDGGVGKTTDLVLIADYLKAKDQKMAPLIVTLPMLVSPPRLPIGSAERLTSWISGMKLISILFCRNRLALVSDGLSRTYRRILPVTLPIGSKPWQHPRPSSV